VGGQGGHKENIFHVGYRYFLEPHNAYLGMALLKKSFQQMSQHNRTI